MSKKSVVQYHRPQTDLALSNPDIIAKNGTKIVLEGDEGNRVIFEGSGLVFKNGLLKSGEIDSLTFENDKGKVFLTMTNIDLDAQTQPGIEAGALLEYAYVFGLRHDNLILGSKGTDMIIGLLGNDVIKARGGDDLIAGHYGNDVITGGGGEDVFQFQEGHGKDRITDFDADGSDGKQDLIQTSSTYDSIKNVKGNAVIDFGHGDTLTLIGVKANEIDASDFVV